MKVYAYEPYLTFFTILFDFFKEARIHATVDHMSDYAPIKEIILDSEIVEFRYNERLDSYGFYLYNEGNKLADTLLIFSFGDLFYQQVLIKVHREDVFISFALHGVKKHIPVYEERFMRAPRKVTGFMFRFVDFMRNFFSFYPSPAEKIEKEVMSMGEFRNFLYANGKNKRKGAERS